MFDNFSESKIKFYRQLIVLSVYKSYELSKIAALQNQIRSDTEDWEINAKRGL